MLLTSSFRSQAPAGLVGNDVTLAVIPYKDLNSANIVTTRLKEALVPTSKPQSNTHVSAGKLARTSENVRPNHSCGVPVPI